MLAQSRPAEHAYDVLKKALEANVFYHDPDMKLSLKLALLGKGYEKKKITKD